MTAELSPMPASPTSNAQVMDRTDTEAYLKVRALLDTGLLAGEPADVWNPGDVSTIQTETHRLRALLDPVEIERPYDQALFRSVGGKGTLSLINPAEAGSSPSFGAPMTMTRTARRQLAGQVLPGHGLTFMNGLRATGDTGGKLADISWNHMLQSCGAKTPMLRTVRFPDQPVRTIRAVLSQRYAIVDNVDVLDAVMDCADARGLPVISCKITEDALRIRLCLDPTLTDAAAMERFQQVEGYRPGETKPAPVPMIEIWNSETGKAAVGARAGLYEVLCTNGMVGFGGNASWRWTHQGGSGGSDRIRDGLGSALTAARVIADGFVAKFKDSARIAIDDAFALLGSWGGKDISQTQAARVNEAMQDPTSGPTGTLGNLISGITLAAQAETDLFDQSALEQLATSFLFRGLEEAAKTGTGPGEFGVIRNMRQQG